MSDTAGVTFTRERFEALLSAPRVLALSEAKARRMLPRAQRLALAAGAPGFAGALTITTGTRPGTKARGGVRRPYVRISADLTDEVRRRDARATKTYRQILREASRA